MLGSLMPRDALFRMVYRLSIQPVGVGSYGGLETMWAGVIQVAVHVLGRAENFPKREKRIRLRLCCSLTIWCVSFIYVSSCLEFTDDDSMI